VPSNMDVLGMLAGYVPLPKEKWDQRLVVPQKRQYMQMPEGKILPDLHDDTRGKEYMPEYFMRDQHFRNLGEHGDVNIAQRLPTLGLPPPPEPDPEWHRRVVDPKGQQMMNMPEGPVLPDLHENMPSTKPETPWELNKNLMLNKRGLTDIDSNINILRMLYGPR